MADGIAEILDKKDTSVELGCPKCHARRKYVDSDMVDRLSMCCMSAMACPTVVRTIKCKSCQKISATGAFYEKPVDWRWFKPFPQRRKRKDH